MRWVHGLSYFAKPCGAETRFCIDENGSVLFPSAHCQHANLEQLTESDSRVMEYYDPATDL
jgi:hypothetical protein